MDQRPAAVAAPLLAGIPAEPSAELRPVELRSAQSDLPDGSALLHSLALLGELEASLRNSQRALVSRDVVGIERGTHEQWRLQQALRALWSEDRTPLQDRASAGDGFGWPGQAQLAAGVRIAKARVLHLARIQLALLARAQRSLNALSRLLDGPGASYSPPACRSAVWPRASSREKAQICRV
jgi:hypothetical protein